ncbi:acetylxylan esterase [Acidaminobacter sp. JC074]|uniref:alpha/beta fold hydrolase n=1 Tax=Acidaminobacter sp. JC074 TaxID=2530199 RepID=UPI001F0DF157|nr:alpha/beta fold hydrolase [Acidaminobacter sp. JC074]MCH4887506.1 acetylxylan esterase [Acidaminobacter sp. JC074]
MAFIDLEYDELLAYTGMSPKAEDFDAFWKEKVSSLTYDNADLVESEFKVPFATCYDLYFNSHDDVKIHSKLVIPNKLGQSPALLKFHGYAGYSGEWSELIHYAACGFTIAAMDCRGQGGESSDQVDCERTLYGHVIRGAHEGRDHLYYVKVFLDTLVLAQVVSNLEDVDESNISAFGDSQGGALALVCASLFPIKRVSVAYPFLCDYKRVWSLKLDTFAYKGLGEHFRRFDPRHENEDDFFETLSCIDVQNFVGNIKGKAQLFTGLIDDVCPPSTQFAAFNKIKTDKKLEVYPDYGHEKLKDLLDLRLQFFMEALDD